MQVAIGFGFPSHSRTFSNQSQSEVKQTNAIGNHPIENRTIMLVLGRLLELGRNLNKAEVEGLKQCAYYFKQLDQVNPPLTPLSS